MENENLILTRNSEGQGATIGVYRLLEKDLTQKDKALGIRMLTPKHYLFGTQRRCEYNTRSQRWVVEMQESKYTMSYFLLRPSIVIASNQRDGLHLLISDGHHRNRFVQRHVVPTIIFSEQDAFEIISKKHGNLNFYEFKNHLQDATYDALYDFSVSLPDSKFPQAVKGAHTVEDLLNIPGFAAY